jgi:hypothetical protein
VRAASKRRARARHQASAEGRLDHRDAQARYRARRRLQVTDQGSREVDKSKRVPPPAEPSIEIAIEAVLRGGSESDGVVERAQGILRCAFCGRFGRWMRGSFLRRRALPESSAG